MAGESVPGVLTEEDRRLLAHLDDEIEDAESATEYEAVAREIRDRLARHRAEFRRFKTDVEARLDRLERGGGAGPGDDDPPIVHYANIPEDEREGLLSTSDHIAVELHVNWGDIAWTMSGRGDPLVGVDTKVRANARHNPSKLKHRLTTHLGMDLQATQIHRGLKRLASLAGGEEHVDEQTGRVKILGGWYEYREAPTADKRDTRRVLVEATE